MSKADYILIISNIYMARYCDKDISKWIGLAGLVIGLVYFVAGV